MKRIFKLNTKFVATTLKTRELNKRKIKPEIEIYKID